MQKKLSIIVQGEKELISVIEFYFCPKASVVINGSINSYIGSTQTQG